MITVATVDEPRSRDPMVSTADLVGILKQQFFETLRTTTERRCGSSQAVNSESAPCWRRRQRKQAVDAFDSESDAQKRLALWANVHRAIFDETPTIKIGNFIALAAHSPKLGGVVPPLWPYFWNASIKS